MTNTETENGIELISDRYGQMMFQGLTAGVSAHLAKISALQESEKDLTETEAALLERFSGFAGKKGKISPNGLSTKMLRECLAATEALTSLQFSLKWESWGMISNGNCSTQKTSDYRRTGSECTLSDILEQRVESKYFLSLEQMKKIIFTSTLSDAEKAIEETRKCSPIVGGVEALDTAAGGGRGHHTAIPMFGIDYNIEGQERQISNAVTTRNVLAGVSNLRQDGTAVCIPVLTPDRAKKRQNGRRFKDNGEGSFTLTSQDRHGVAIKVREATKKGYSEAEEGDCINIAMPESKTRRGRVGKGVANTLDCSCEQAVPVIWYDKYNCYIAIRKLTPRECFRLQGWEDKYFERAQFVNSDSQLYKQAGNGVTVAVVEDIARAINKVE